MDLSCCWWLGFQLCFWNTQWFFGGKIWVKKRKLEIDWKKKTISRSFFFFFFVLFLNYILAVDKGRCSFCVCTGAVCFVTNKPSLTVGGVRQNVELMQFNFKRPGSNSTQSLGSGDLLVRCWVVEWHHRFLGSCMIVSVVCQLRNWWFVNGLQKLQEFMRLKKRICNKRLVFMAKLCSSHCLLKLCASHCLLDQKFFAI